MDLTNQTPANAALTIPVINFPKGSNLITDLFGIPDGRQKELAIALNQFKEKVGVDGKFESGVEISSTIQMMSYVAETPNELAFLVYRLGAFNENRTNPLNQLAELLGKGY